MSNEEIIAEYEADRSNPENHDTKEQDLIKALDKARAEGCSDLETAQHHSYEAGRQSAQKEIERLKTEVRVLENDLLIKEDEIKNLNTCIKDMNTYRC